ncbi:MAG: hypothetical protein QM817_38110 [Archangium sp.]
MNCETAQAAILDESIARSEAFEAHVASCAECTALANAHRKALALRASTPALASRRSMGEARRRAGAGFGVLLAVGGGAGLLWLEVLPRLSSTPVETGPEIVELRGPEPRVVVQVMPPEQQQVVNDVLPPEVDLEWLALMQLQRNADRVVLAEYREEEVTRRVFGALPGWVAPRKSSPMRSLGRAASPVVFTQEDVP